MAKIKATDLDYQKVFQQKLTEANSNLKRNRVRVSIKQTGNSLQLRATLPLKPDDKQHLIKSKKQYDLTLVIPANLEGLKTDKEESYELGKLIARHTFVWNDKYLGIRISEKKREKQRIKTIGELLDQFEENYYKTRKKAITSQNTFANYVCVIKRNFPPTTLATKKNFESAINSCTGNKKKRINRNILCFYQNF